MKKTIVLLPVLLIIALLTNAQFDEKFYYPSTTLRPIDSSLQAEQITLRTDTVTLTGLWLTPKGKPKATIFFLHGAGGNVTSYLFMTKPLVEAGYQVFMTDFRGYGKSTGKPTHLNIAKDGQLFFDYLLKRPEVKGTKLIVFGASIGTQIATKLARDNAANVAALILEAPMNNFTDIAVAYAPQEQHAMIKQFVVVPYGAKDDIKEVKAPVLVIHSKEDKECPYSHGETVFNNATGQKEMWTVTGGHIQAMKLFPAEYIARINKLIR